MAKFAIKMAIRTIYLNIKPPPFIYMQNCALRNKLLVVALVIISSVTETKPPEFKLSDQPLNLWAADE
jgi:hypothetical protein